MALFRSLILDVLTRSQNGLKKNETNCLELF